MIDEYIVDGAESAVDATQTEAEPLPQAETATPETQEAQAQEATRPEDQEAEEHKRKSGVQRLKAKVQLEREARERAERETAELKQRLASLEAPGKPVAPKEQDFDSYEAYQASVEDYQEKLITWKLDQRDRDRMVSESKRREEQLAKTWEERLTEAVDKHSDLPDLIDHAIAQNIRLTQPMDAFLKESERGIDVLYHLAKNPDEIKRIAGLAPTRQVAELGRLEDKLSGKTAEEPRKETPKPTSQTPKPPTPITSAVPVVQSVKDNDGFFVY